MGWFLLGLFVGATIAFIGAGLLFRSIRDADEWERQFKEQHPDWPEEKDG